MQNDLIISVSGLRGVVGESLTAEVAQRYAAAFVAGLPEGPILVTRDGRANGPQLVGPVVAGILQSGKHRVIDAGIAATPTTGVLIRHHGCAGGIQISASHNPAEYNGMKLFSAEGRVVPAGQGEQVLERFNAMSAEVDAADGSAPIDKLIDTTSAHLALIEGIVNVGQIAARKYHVLLDANHGAGSILGKKLLEQLGCTVTMLGGEPNGQFDHVPEPTAENLAGVLEEVTACSADIGFCQDPDADRLAIIDEQGRYLGEEYTLALCVNHALRHGHHPVITNCSTSRMAEELADDYGVPFYRSAVGEANVVDLMLQHEGAIGGEGNGGVIDPRVGLVRDSFVAMALVLAAMDDREMRVSKLADELPEYAICKVKLELDRAKIPAALDALEAELDETSASRLDGLRLDWVDHLGAGRWILVRPSNTEPIVRVFAEAPTADEAEQLCEKAVKVLGKV